MKIQISENTILRRIELSDAKVIFNTINTQRDYLGEWLPFVDLTKKIKDTEGFIRTVLEAPENCKEFVFVIMYDDEFAGLIGFKGTDRQNKKTEIGYWLSEGFQKKGIITESVKSLEKYAFDVMKINRIQIKCAVGNIASKNIPRRLGYKLEGVERDGELLSGGKFTDLEVYSKLREKVKI
jgi:ribosomal-protein-serine acetyltransferase